uniref:Uncharacterized protein n=1 Tax=Cacopsylla melanoneura TaxID=428564 RepID=A0A8D8RW57_9HEMI
MRCRGTPSPAPVFDASSRVSVFSAPSPDPSILTWMRRSSRSYWTCRGNLGWCRVWRPQSQEVDSSAVGNFHGKSLSAFLSTFCSSHLMADLDRRQVVCAGDSGGVLCDAD